MLTFQLVIEQRHTNDRELSRLIAEISTLFSALQWPIPRVLREKNNDYKYYVHDGQNSRSSSSGQNGRHFLGYIMIVLSKMLLLVLCTPLLVSASAIRHERRSIQQGWSLQSSSCPSGTNSCGGGACCPSSLYCFAAQNDEVASCCASSK